MLGRYQRLTSPGSLGRLLQGMAHSCPEITVARLYPGRHSTLLHVRKLSLPYRAGGKIVSQPSRSHTRERSALFLAPGSADRLNRTNSKFRVVKAVCRTPDKRS